MRIRPILRLTTTVLCLWIFLTVCVFCPSDQYSPLFAEDKVTAEKGTEKTVTGETGEAETKDGDDEPPRKHSGPHLGDEGLSASATYALARMKSPKHLLDFLIQCFHSLEYRSASYALDFSELPELTPIEKEDYSYQFIHILRRLDNLDIAKLPVMEEEQDFYELHPDPDYAAIPFQKHEDGTWRVAPEYVVTIPEVFEKIRDKLLVMDRPTWVNYLPSWIFKRVGGEFLVIHFFVIAVFVVLGYVVKRLFPKVTSRVVPHLLLKQGKTQYTEPLRKAMRPFASFMMFYIWCLSLYYIPVLPSILKFFLFVLEPLCVIQLGRTCYRLVDIFRLWLGAKWGRSTNKVKHALVDLIAGVVKCFIICCGCVIIVQQFGFSPVAIVSGMGIGGIAIALAAQQTIANFFGSLTILLDQPFVVGDYIITDSVEGKVESIGLRSTKIRTPSDTCLVIPNNVLSSCTINNCGHRSARRYKTVIGLQYDTPVVLFRAYCDGVRKLIEEHPATTKEDIRVHVSRFSSSSIDIELVCHFDVADIREENREKEKLLLDMIDLAHRIGVSFAFPTSTNYVIHSKETTYPTAAPQEENKV